MKKILNYLTKKKVAVGLLSILLVVCLSAIAFMTTGKVNKVSASTSTAKIKIMSLIDTSSLIKLTIIRLKSIAEIKSGIKSLTRVGS